MTVLETAFIRLIDDEVDKKIDAVLDGPIMKERTEEIAYGILEGIAFERRRAREYLISIGLSPDALPEHASNSAN